MKVTIPFKLEHTCELCGCSCLAQLVGPLSDAEHDNAVNAYRELAAETPDAPAVNPIMKGIKPDGSCMYFLNFPQKKCIFLGDDHLCRVHARFGADKKPAACRRFPLIGIRTENEIRLGIKPYCYANMRVCDLSPASDSLYENYRADPQMSPVVQDLIDHAAYRPAVRVQDPDEIARANAQEYQILAWLKNDITYAELLPALLRGAREKYAALPKPFLQDVSALFKTLVPAVRAEADKLCGSAHARHVAALADALSSPLTDTSALSPNAPFWRYAKYALFQAVFLRETSRFPDVSTGTFALALGCLLAAQSPDHASDRLTAWLRLMAQTKLFETLFPSPQSLSALARHLMRSSK